MSMYSLLLPVTGIQRSVKLDSVDYNYTLPTVEHLVSVQPIALQQINIVIQRINSAVMVKTVILSLLCKETDGC